jgi:hypothetical protein
MTRGEQFEELRPLLFADQDGKVVSTLTLDVLGGRIQTIRSVVKPASSGTWVPWRTPGRLPAR